MDVYSLEVKELFKNPLPGWLCTDAWLAQGRSFATANAMSQIAWSRWRRPDGTGPVAQNRSRRAGEHP